jgi:hypothetical protein
MNEWISVETKRPKISTTQIPQHESVTVFFTDGNITYMGYCISFCGDEDSRGCEWHGRFLGSRGDDVIIDNITHWMNLPELPKKV